MKSWRRPGPGAERQRQRFGGRFLTVAVATSCATATAAMFAGQASASPLPNPNPTPIPPISFPTVQLVSNANGQCLSGIYVRDCIETSSLQKWQVIPTAAAGQYMLKNSASGPGCLGITFFIGGANLFPCDYSPGVVWTLDQSRGAVQWKFGNDENSCIGLPAAGSSDGMNHFRSCDDPATFWHTVNTAGAEPPAPAPGPPSS